MRYFGLLLLGCVGWVESSDPANRLRGASPSFIASRNLESATIFECVPRRIGGAGRPADLGRAPAEQFPISIVNDDFCDCEDGSDEPGTAACAGGEFFCANLGGYRSKVIPSSFVNDRVCDCCDGSDEWATGGTCKNTCAEELQRVRSEAQEKAEGIRSALVKKKSMVEEAKQIWQSVQADVRQLGVERAKADKEAEALQARVERFEAMKSTLDERPDEPLESEVPKPDDDHLEFTPDPAPGTPSNEDDDSSGSDSDDGMTETKLVHDVLMTQESCSALLLEPVGRFGAIKTRLQHVLYTLLGKPSPMLNSDVSNRGKKKLANDCINDLQSQKRAAESNARDIKRRFESATKKSEIDYGFERALLVSHGKCIKKSFGQYEFEHCPFEKVKQYENKRMIASLGDYASFDTDSLELKYTQGARCWQGPPRSCTVKLVCGAEEDLLTVDEPERCTYEIKYSTPAICSESEAERLEAVSKGEEHDEL